MKYLCLLIVVCFHINKGFSQYVPTALLGKADSVFVELSEDETTYFYTHTIDKGHSLYALSKLFDVSLDQIFQYNGIDRDDVIHMGQEILVPLNDAVLFKGGQLTTDASDTYVPVYYKVKPKETLFRISRIYFRQATADLMERNQLQNNILSPGQALVIGWLPRQIEAVTPQEDEFEEDLEPSETIIVDETLATTEVEPIENQTQAEDIVDSTAVDSYPFDFNAALLGQLTYTENMKTLQKNEVANWDKTIPDNGTVYVLHKSAIIDSYMELFNPIIKKTVLAKVIGRIPYGAYEKSVNLVLSPRTAKVLGARDKRFKVVMKALVYADALTSTHE